MSSLHICGLTTDHDLQICICTSFLCVSFLASQRRFFLPRIFVILWGSQTFTQTSIDLCQDYVDLCEIRKRSLEFWVQRCFGIAKVATSLCSNLRTRSCLHQGIGLWSRGGFIRTAITAMSISWKLAKVVWNSEAAQAHRVSHSHAAGISSQTSDLLMLQPSVQASCAAFFFAANISYSVIFARCECSLCMVFVFREIALFYLVC